MRILIFFLFGLANSARAELIRGVAPSEITGFESQWCAPNEVASVVREVCFGTTSFGEDDSVRAMTFAVDGRVQLYVESDFRGVDLLKPSFEITGPLGGGLSVAAELGRAVVGIDAFGEVSLVSVESLRLGRVVARRR